MLINLTPDKKSIEEKRLDYEKIKLSYIPQSDLIVEKGIYQDALNFNFAKDEFCEEISENIDNGSWNWKYGVADNIEQIKEYLKKYIDDPDEKYIIAVTPVFQHKENEGKEGGWRWHKWGPYIGKLNPQCEYLDDEDFGDDFKYILCFQLYKVIE